MNHRKGAAMFVVLGSVILFSLLGYVGLRLAEVDNRLAGDAVEIRSMRMSSEAAFQFSIARLEGNAGLTALQLQKYRDNPKLRWMDFQPRSGTFALRATKPDWFELGSGDDKSGFIVEVIGLGAPNLQGRIPLQLRAFGRGRGGEVHVSTALFEVRGLVNQVNLISRGPDQALLARGGAGNFDAGIQVDKGFYSGGNGSSVLKIQPSGNFRVGAIKALGDVEILSSTGGAFIQENSYVGGSLKVSTNANFEKNLVVQEGLLPIDGSLNVMGSFYFFGTNIPSPINNRVAVGRDMWVRDVTWKSAGPLTVGSPSSTTHSRVRFDQGIYLESDSTNIYGDLHVGTRTGGLQQSVGRNAGSYLKVTGDLNFYAPLPGDTRSASTVVFRTGQTIVGGNAWVAGPTEVSYASVDIGGSAVLASGVQDMDRGVVTIRQRTWLNRLDQKLFEFGMLNFGGTAHFNGSLNWNTSDRKQSWQFLPDATSREWSYTKTPSTPIRSANEVIHGTRVVERSSDLVIPDELKIKVPTLPTLAELGYSSDELNADTASNPASVINLNNLTPGLIDGENRANWNEIYWDNQQDCKLNDWQLGSKVQNANVPTGEQLGRIYERERKNTDKTKNRMYGDYLVIHVTDISLFRNMSGAKDVDMDLPAGVKILWVIDVGFSVSSHWYSANPGAYQLLVARAELTDFGWAGNFYGFIQLQGGLRKLRAGPNSVLYGALETTSSNATLEQNGSSHGGNELTIMRSSPVSKQMFNDLVRNFSTIQPGEDIGDGDPRVLIFNGDRDLPPVSTTPTLTATDGWIQVHRLQTYK